MRTLSSAEMEAINAKLKDMKINTPRVTYDEYLRMVKNYETTRPYLINIRGANGTGKSTVPLLITFTDPDVVIVLNSDGKEILTYSPQHNLTMMGRYYTKTGGLDISLFQDKHYIAEVLTKVWNDTNTNILMEGIVVSSSYGFYADLFNQLSASNDKRDVLVMSMIMDLDDLEKRIMARNGGKQIKMHYVKGKQDTVRRNIPKFERDGFTSWTTSNRDVEYEGMIDWFLGEISANR